MNTAIFLLLVAANLWQFIAVPLLPSLWAWTLIPLAFTSNTLWAMIHEAIHGHIPRWQGKILAQLFGSSFTFLSAAHLTHHALNRTEAEQLEIVPRGEPLWHARIRYYFFLSGGLYFSELFVPMAFILPFAKIREIYLKSSSFTARLIARAIVGRRAIVLESLASILFLIISAVLYGDRWPLLAGIIFARAFFISSLDYIYHYGAPLDRDNGVFNLWLPRPLRLLMLNFNLHREHHHSPAMHWHQLHPSTQLYHEALFRQALRVWKGPVKLSAHD